MLRGRLGTVNDFHWGFKPVEYDIGVYQPTPFYILFSFSHSVSLYLILRYYCHSRMFGHLWHCVQRHLPTQISHIKVKPPRKMPIRHT